MLIRKNTKAFKTILEILTTCRDRPDRQELIRLYVTKAGDTINERIGVEGIEDAAGLFYEMNYQAVLGNLKSSNHQLHQSEDVPGIYFFHSSSNKVWDETPFEFDVAVKEEFKSLPDLPTPRKKEKAAKFVFPGPHVKKEPGPAARDKAEAKKEKGEKEKKSEAKKGARVVAMWPAQPDYKLKRDIRFTGLERIFYRQSQSTKRDVLDYYNGMAEYLLPYLKDRPQVIHLHRDGRPGPPIASVEQLSAATTEELPEWLNTAPAGKGSGKERLLLCNDREHLLYYVELGCLEFRSRHSRIRSPASPDYLIVGIESPDYTLGHAVAAALATKEILTGLKLPSCVKTDGVSALHVYVPLDSKSDYTAARHVAEYLCKLVRLKVPDLVAIKGSKQTSGGKVLLDYEMNAPGGAVAAPYSLVSGQSPTVAAPLLWGEVAEGLNADSLNLESIFKRLKNTGDPFEGLSKKKVNAQSLLERLDHDYSFLIG